MDLKKLEYLESIYRLRNFTKAAKELYISQPSISSAVQSLEDELGVTLINRNTRPLSFTVAGEEFMEYVHRILKEVKDAAEAMKLLSKQSQESLHIAIYSSSTSQIIPKVYIDFQTLFPQYTLSITETTLTAMLEQIQSGELDLAYTLIPDNYDRSVFKVIPMESCELWLLISASHPLASEEAIGLDQLSTEKIFSYPEGSLIRQKLDTELARYHITIRHTVLHRLDLINTLVEQNQGVSFILHDNFHSLPESSGLRIKPLKTPILFQTGLIYKQGTRMTNAMKDMKIYLENLHA